MKVIDDRGEKPYPSRHGSPAARGHGGRCALWRRALARTRRGRRARGVAVDAVAAVPPAAPAAGLSTPMKPMRDAAAELVIAAMNFLDRPYRAGGHSIETGFDCSGFTRHLFEPDAGHRAAAPRRRPGARSRAESGAARCIARWRPGVLQHVAPYLLARRPLHRRRPLHPRAAQRRSRVRLESLASDYWARRFTGARRPTAAGHCPISRAPLNVRPAPHAVARSVAAARRACTPPRTNGHGTMRWAKPSSRSPIYATPARCRRSRRSRCAHRACSATASAGRCATCASR